MSPASRRNRALAGLVTGLSGLAVSYAVTSLLHARADPVQSVAEVVIARTPGSVAESLIGLVGRHDKPLLVTGVSVGLLALSTVAGILSRRSRAAANTVFVAMGVVALLAGMSRPGFTPSSLLPVAAGTATWLVVLAVLLDVLPEGEGRPADGDRRRFLMRSGIVVGLAVVVAAGGRLAGRTQRSLLTARRQLRLPVTSGQVPAGADVGVPGVPSWRVPNGPFYRIDTALVVPSVLPADWSLRIHGMVDREIRLSYTDLLARKVTEDWVTICCVSNPVGGDLIGNAWWSGVLLADLLAEAGVQQGADAVKQTSKDGWTCGTPLSALTDGRNAMLAVAMNGQPLPVEHGFPVRTIVPGLYGYVSACKWVVDLEVTSFDRFTAYWTGRGWSERGPVKTESRIDVPGQGGRVKAGSVRVGGSAWAQHTGISRVEYQVDGGPWQRAELGQVPSDDTWVQWAGTVQVASGHHTLVVRATDRSGYTQTAVRHDVVPDGATGWDTVRFDAG